MRTFLLACTACLLSLLLAAPAHAGKLVFGTSDTIRFVANTTLRGPGGERLFLGRKITTKAFLLPYATKDDGFVLGISGESSRYFPIPTGSDLEKLQDAGFLPRPMPHWEMDGLDWMFGHLLWVTLLGMAGWYLSKRFFAARQRKGLR